MKLFVGPRGSATDFGCLAGDDLPNGVIRVSGGIFAGSGDALPLVTNVVCVHA
jgi:hypothetical protein